MKLWAGRFKVNTHQLLEEYNASIHFDKALARFDILGSIAHIKMLAHCNLVTDEEACVIEQGLTSLLQRCQAEELSFTVADEDIHMNIERMLHELVGELAGKLHTGRSRNDQVALDLRLYVRSEIIQTVDKLLQLQAVLLELATVNFDVIMPGYTHLQRAEPIRFSQHMLAYFNMLQRDIERFCDVFDRVNKSPLGAGALAGSGMAVDRAYAAKLLKFDGLCANSLDAVSDRDFVAEFIFNASLVMMHLSKLSEEIILWSSTEFSFIELSDEFCTGSSMMPQKKNPDVAELARGKTGRVYGALMALLTVLKGLPLAYNKDLQEDKEGLFDTVKTLSQTLDIYAPMLASMKVNHESMQHAVERDYANATQLANYIVHQGIPFRVAHAITGEIVLHCIEQNLFLSQLSLDEYKSFCEDIEDDLFEWLTVNSVVEAHKACGGTAKQSVINQIKQAEVALKHGQDWVNTVSAKMEGLL